MVDPSVPQPGPARLKPNAGPDEWLEAAKNCKYLSEHHMKQLCELVKEYMMEESNIQPVSTPVTICGDIHGQFYDLLELFRVAGGMPGDTRPAAPSTQAPIITSEDIEPPSVITDPKLKQRLRKSSPPNSVIEDDGDEETGGQATQINKHDGGGGGGEGEDKSASPIGNFIFLGDYVDRGYFSLETLTLLLCLKARYPNKITLVRGTMSQGRLRRCMASTMSVCRNTATHRCGKACCQVFDFMTLGVCDGKVPEIRTLDQVRIVARAQEIPHEGAFCDLVWSDPDETDDLTWAVSPRGAGWLFGSRVADEFCAVNDLNLIARAHQLVNEGYKYHFDSQAMVTVWSAPNYCYRCANMASVCEVREDLKPVFKLFAAVPAEMRHVPATRPQKAEYFL
ncbi:serine/threonine-protein phosphatase [Nannizzia gypsea CBS 118893]|uniref:protein-serine/threonine phosphatase n=1 Tax=Arthroderma gypseum (strain ATCC MYA-4604 / CBS 118893) TaxID=535722 RepID=E5R360_ARTGP|nr:serine/threonine-protein phosphatase [Nannizzia gypsea CBS 118893]EFQ97089.1 serine/threonine-protein phosphatase [Nannizzia gypsea CBS 118893]